MVLHPNFERGIKCHTRRENITIYFQSLRNHRTVLDVSQGGGGGEGGALFGDRCIRIRLEIQGLVLKIGEQKKILISTLRQKLDLITSEAEIHKA